MAEKHMCVSYFRARQDVTKTCFSPPPPNQDWPEHNRFCRCAPEEEQEEENNFQYRKANVFSPFNCAYSYSSTATIGHTKNDTRRRKLQVNRSDQPRIVPTGRHKSHIPASPRVRHPPVRRHSYFPTCGAPDDISVGSMYVKAADSYDSLQSLGMNEQDEADMMPMGRRHWEQHAASPRRVSPVARNDRHMDHSMKVDRPERPLRDYEGQELANQSIRDYLVYRFEESGSHFSRWWYHLSTIQRTDMINLITQGTAPLIAAPLSQISNMLESGGPRYGARVLTNFSLKNILGPCSCSEEDCLMHDYRDQLLHDLHYYIMCWDVADEMDYRFCVKMFDQGIFPDRSQDSVVKFLEPPQQHDPLQVHRVVIVTENTPRETVQEILALVDSGYMKEQVPFSYFLLRDSYRLAIYALLVELFDELELGIQPAMPLARLQGCEYCRRTCQGPAAIECDLCQAKWWCCTGCRNVSAHGRRCPIGKPTKIRVQFK
jgi:hypothetical protein